MEDLGGLVDVVGKPVEECVGNQFGEEQARNNLHNNLAEKLVVMFTKERTPPPPESSRRRKG